MYLHIGAIKSRPKVYFTIAMVHEAYTLKRTHKKAVQQSAPPRNVCSNTCNKNVEFFKQSGSLSQNQQIITP